MVRLPLTAILPVLLGIASLVAAAHANEPTINHLVLWPEHSNTPSQPITPTTTNITNEPPVATTPLTTEGFAHVLRRDLPRFNTRHETDPGYDLCQRKGGIPKFKAGSGGGSCKSGAQSVNVPDVGFAAVAAAAAVIMVVGGMGFS